MGKKKRALKKKESKQKKESLEEIGLTKNEILLLKALEILNEQPTNREKLKSTLKIPVTSLRKAQKSLENKKLIKVLDNRFRAGTARGMIFKCKSDLFNVLYTGNDENEIKESIKNIKIEDLKIMKEI
ncbi:MAG: hypothetical protein ACQESP_12825 [Candidatus Muiribacteriota bacterium]